MLATKLFLYFVRSFNRNAKGRKSISTQNSECCKLQLFKQLHKYYPIKTTSQPPVRRVVFVLTLQMTNICTASLSDHPEPILTHHRWPGKGLFRSLLENWSRDCKLCQVPYFTCGHRNTFQHTRNSRKYAKAVAQGLSSWKVIRKKWVEAHSKENKGSELLPTQKDIYVKPVGEKKQKQKINANCFQLV